MTILKITLSSLASLGAIFILTKLIGNKQLSEANIFDYINGITVGSIAAEMATSLEGDILKPLVAMIVYTVVVIFFAFLNRKSFFLRLFWGKLTFFFIFSGKAIILLDKNKIYFDNLRKANIDINRFLVQCRLAGYFDLDEIQTAVFETNGKISFLPKEKFRNLRPDDTKLKVEQSEIMTNVIIDGKVVAQNLASCGRDRIWLQNELKKQYGLSEIGNILLASFDGKNKLNVYKRIDEKNDQSPFE